MAGPRSPSTDVGHEASTLSPRGAEFRDAGSDPADEAESVRVRAGAVLAAAVGVLAATAVGLAAGAWPETAGAVLCGIGLAVGVALLSEEDPVRIAPGTVLGTLAACGIVASALSGPTLLVATLTLAAFAASSIPLGGVGDDRLVDTAAVLGYALVPVGVVVGLDLSLRVSGALFGGTLELVSPTGLAGNLTVFLLVAWAALFASLAALRGLPVVELAPRSDRERIRSRVQALDRRLRRGLLWGGVALAAWFVLWALSEAGVGVVTDLLSIPAAVTGHPFVRIPLLAVTLLAVVVAVGVRVLQVAGGTVVELTRRSVALAVGTVLAVGAVPASGVAFRALSGSVEAETATVLLRLSGAIGPLSTVLILAGVAVLAFLVAMLVVPAVVGLGLAPERSAAPAFAAGGLVASVALAVDRLPAVVAFVAVVAGLVVWDLGEFARGLDEEVDDAPATRAELVHAAGALGVGAVVTAGAIVAHAVVTAVEVDPATGLAALTFAFLGAVLLAAVLRG